MVLTSADAAFSGIFSVRLSVPEIALSCRKSEFYNSHAMFTSSVSDVTFLFVLMPLCMAFRLREA